MSQPALSRALVTSLTALLLCAIEAPASLARAAERPSVSIGDVNISVDAGAGDPAADLGRALRSALSDELTRIAGIGPVKHPLIVSATLTKLSSERRDERAKATATISLALRRADDQVLFAELRGRASVEEASGNLASLRRAALQGAVRGALARLPEVVQRSR
jgi:predicted flap endonuclease-1-like 5' DNA nuclease